MVDKRPVVLVAIEEQIRPGKHVPAKCEYPADYVSSLGYHHQSGNRLVLVRKFDGSNDTGFR